MIKKNSELYDKQGGIVYKDKDSLKRAENADLVTLPKNLQNGINCSNCEYVEIMSKKLGLGFCTHKKVRLPVSKAMCCKYQDSEGMIRQWKK